MKSRKKGAGLGATLKNEAKRLSERIVEQLFADERRAAKIADALGAVQRGKRNLDRRQEDLMRQLGLAPRGEYKALGKRLSSFKRRTRELGEKLDQLLRR